MSFGEQMRRRREELGLTRQALADRLGVSVSAVGNYETGISAPKEEVLLRLFDALEAEPNYLYRGSYRAASGGHSDEERRLLAKYRDLPLSGRQTVHTLVDALTEMTDDLRTAVPAAERRVIPLYTSPAAAGFAGVRRGLRADTGHRRRTARRGAGRADTGRLHGAGHRRRRRGLREP